MLPPGLRRLPRRLPLRRDFEFVDRNRDSMSIMGFVSQDESGASVSNSQRSSAVLGIMEGVLGNTIYQWQVNALIDSLSEDEDEGDVEDALRRLKGQMNPQKQRGNKTKFDNWAGRSGSVLPQATMAAKHLGTSLMIGKIWRASWGLLRTLGCKAPRQ